MPSLYESLTTKQRARRGELLAQLQRWSVLRWDDPGAYHGVDRQRLQADEKRRQIIWNQLARTVHELREERLVTLAELYEYRGDLSHNDVRGILAEPKPRHINSKLVTEMRALAMQQTRDDSAGPGLRAAEFAQEKRDAMASLMDDFKTSSRKRLEEWLRARHPRLSEETFQAILRGEHER